jgi:hypothetical protein
LFDFDFDLIDMVDIESRELNGPISDFDEGIVGKTDNETDRIPGMTEQGRSGGD